jgi:hypothetical protein
MKRFISASVAILFSLLAVTSTAYILKADVIDGGGTKMISSSHILRGSMAQLTIGKVSSANYTGYIGFWHPPYAVGPGIEENPAHYYSSVPKVFSLSQNYPNPVVNSTSIRYTLPRESYVDVKVYNNAGQEIRTLVKTIQKPGYYRINWDLRGVSGDEMPNGVYFFRMRAGDFTATRKLVILR